jgi:hypothetical protein
MKKKEVRVFFIIVIGSLFFFKMANAHEGIVDQLERMAENYMKVKNSLKVSGIHEINLDHHTVTDTLQQKARREMEEIIRSKNILTEKGLVYLDSHTELTVMEYQIDQNKARLKMKEHTKLQVLPVGPDFEDVVTEYEEDHWFSFIKQKERWKLAGDDLIPVPELQYPKPERTKVIYLETTTVEDEPPQLNMLIVDEDFEPCVEKQEPPETAKGSLNRKSIVDYAYRYWNNYNFFYRKYERDCTNFVSQALRARIHSSRPW